MGLRGERIVAKNILEATGNPVRLKLTPDRSVLDANGQDLAFVTVEAVDEKNRLQMNSELRVHFSVSGAGVIAAVGSGDGKALDSYAGDSFNLFNGRALVVLRTSHAKGQIKLEAKAASLVSLSIIVESRLVGSSIELRWIARNQICRGFRQSVSLLELGIMRSNHRRSSELLKSTHLA